MQKRKSVTEMHKEWLRKPGYKKAYDDLEGEFAVATAVIKARTLAKLTQEQLAAKMGTTQSAIARLEGGRVRPSYRTLEKVAKATKHRLQLALTPETSGKSTPATPRLRTTR